MTEISRSTANYRLLDAWLTALEARLEQLAARALGSDDEEAELAIGDCVAAAERQLMELERELSAYNPPLQALVRQFGLNPAEERILVLAMAPALDARFRPLIGRVHRNVLLNYVSVDLCLRLLHSDRPSRLASRALFSPRGRLLRQGLVRVAAPSDMPSRQLADAEVSVPEELVSHILGARPEETLKAESAAAQARAVDQDPFAAVVAPEKDLERWRAALASFVRLRASGDRGPVLLMSGRFGSGRRMLASIFARSVALQTRRFRIEGYTAPPDEWANSLRALLRDCLVEGQLPVITDIEGLEPQSPEDRDRAILRQVLLDALEAHPGPIAVTTSRPDMALQLERAVWQFPMPHLSMKEREPLWRRFLGEDAVLAEDVSLMELADLYPLTGGLIRRAAESARSQAAGADGSLVVDQAALREGIRSQLVHRLGDVAEFIEPHGSWADVVVPKDTEDRLHQMQDHFRHRRTVWEEWGFRGKFSTLRGVSALFYGPPGTGKSFTAGVAANELGMDLFRVDLSRIVSKWIGETEKNLARVFDEASQGHVVLFFDEADSLFTKRTQVSSSVDRYANLEVNYLLQRMERYEGVTILATNHDQSLDEAFKRRLQFRILFPLPEPDERKRLWRSLVPASAAVEDGVDWAYLAEEFEMSGGHIRNAIVRAAFRAAAAGHRIDDEVLAWAAGVEYEEMGRLIRR